jgi:methionyl aminopeptidase
MIRLKNARQLERIRESCRILARTLVRLTPMVAAGVTTLELDAFVRDDFKKEGVVPAFLNYEGYPAALCVSINEEVIHGIPSKRVLKNGDIISLDCGCSLDGFFSDSAMTLPVGNIGTDAERLIRITRECLAAGIEKAKAGNRVHHISRAVFEHADASGYGVVRQYCGHGVGFSQHEDPQIPNYVSPGPNPRLVPGMVLAIEPMINLGTGDVRVLADDWTVVTLDRSLSAHFEHTVAIFADHTEILTQPDQSL